MGILWCPMYVIRNRGVKFQNTQFISLPYGKAGNFRIVIQLPILSYPYGKLKSYEYILDLIPVDTPDALYEDYQRLLNILYKAFY